MLRTRGLLSASLGCLLLVAEPGRSIGPLNLVAPVLPSPGDVIKIIDTLTKKESSTSVVLEKGSTVSQGKLLIARTKVDVALERTSRNWRGKVEVQLIVPTEISYSIDLQDIRPHHIFLDEENCQLIVAMPTPRVEDVTPQLSAVRTESNYKHARFRLFDVPVTRDLQTSMLTHDYQARARKAGEKAVEQVREKGRIALQNFLQRLLQGTNPGIVVIVR